MAMISKTMPAFISLLLLLSFGGFSNSDAAMLKDEKSSNGTCDRECLRGFITKYLNALIAQKPESLSVAPNVKFTENCKQITLGDGLWKTAYQLSSYRLDFLDVRQGGAAAYVVLKKGSTNVLLALRLKIVDQKITEIETIYATSTDVSKLQTASAEMTKTPDAAQLNTREKAIEIASLYPKGLKAGSFVTVDVPFVSNAYRYENGLLFAGPGCTMMDGCENIKTQTIPKLAGIIYHVAVVDEEMGIVVLRLNFGPNSMQGKALDCFESFKVYNNQIHAVEAFYELVANGTTFGWDNTAVNKQPSPFTSPGNAGKVVGAGKGVLVPVRFLADKVSIDIYDLSGRLAHTKTIAPSARSNMICIPIGMLPSGHYMGRVRYHAGSKTTCSSFFVVNTIN